MTTNGKTAAKRWEVLSLGYFSRNRYWGEDDGRAYRPALCTSTFVEIGGLNVVIDPPVHGAEMETLLNYRTGLHLADIDVVYVTHGHFDHFVGLGAFPKAKILLPEGEAASVRADLFKAASDKERAAVFPDHVALWNRCATVANDAAEIVPGIAPLPLPGHTLGLLGAVFAAREGVVVVAGDSVMTRDHFFAKAGHINNVDAALTAQSIETLAQVADAIVPGHGNYFVTLR